MIVAASFAYIAYCFGHPAARTDTQVIVHRYEMSDVPPEPPECDGCCGKECKCKKDCNCADLVKEEAPCEDESPCSCNKSCVCGCQTHGCCGCPRETEIKIIILEPDEPTNTGVPEEHGQPAPEPPKVNPVKKPKPKQADECPKG
jgi:hypothetical protein